MKIHRLLLISLFAHVLYGDVMYEMFTTTEGIMGMGKSESTIRTFIKGDYSRTEITAQSELTGEIANTYVVRLDKRAIWLLDAETREYTVVPLGEVTESGQAGKTKDSTITMPEIKIQCQEEKKTILDLECQKYVVSMVIKSDGGNVTLVQTMWISKDVPGYEEISGFNKKLMGLAGGIAQQTIGSIDKESFREFQEKIAGIDGFPLEIDMDFSMPQEEMNIELKTHSEVKKVSIVPISNKVFEIPEGYVQKAD